MNNFLNSAVAVSKRHLPSSIFNPIRSFLTAFLTPWKFSFSSGHFLSSFIRKSVDGAGNPLPWYTYPSIDYLSKLDFSKSLVLEFGGGQSSIWWSRRCIGVRVFDESPEWGAYIAKNNDNIKVSIIEQAQDLYGLEQVKSCLKSEGDKYDVIVVDGFLRAELAKLSMEFLAEGGMIVLDNSEGYGLYDVFSESSFLKVDFYGYAPGVIAKSCTSILFSPNSRFFESNIKI